MECGRRPAVRRGECGPGTGVFGGLVSEELLDPVTGPLEIRSHDQGDRDDLTIRLPSHGILGITPTIELGLGKVRTPGKRLRKQPGAYSRTDEARDFREQPLDERSLPGMIGCIGTWQVDEHLLPEGRVLGAIEMALQDVVQLIVFLTSPTDVDERFESRITSARHEKGSAGSPKGASLRAVFLLFAADFAGSCASASAAGSAAASRGGSASHDSSNAMVRSPICALRLTSCLTALLADERNSSPSKPRATTSCSRVSTRSGSAPFDMASSA